MSSIAPGTSQIEGRHRETERSHQIVSFRLGDEEYGMAINKVREVILVGEITEVPDSPPFVKGLINLRSTVIPIIDLNLRFGFSETLRTEDTRIVVVNFKGKTIGIIVDAVNEVLRITPDQIAPPPPAVVGIDREYIVGLAKLKSRLLILLEIENILSDEEQADGEHQTT
jgi:purine-binding chemotaxis protein CheW